MGNGQDEVGRGGPQGPRGDAARANQPMRWCMAQLCAAFPATSRESGSHAVRACRQGLPGQRQVRGGSGDELGKRAVRVSMSGRGVV